MERLCDYSLERGTLMCRPCMPQVFQKLVQDSTTDSNTHFSNCVGKVQNEGKEISGAQRARAARTSVLARACASHRELTLCNVIILCGAGAGAGAWCLVLVLGCRAPGDHDGIARGADAPLCSQRACVRGRACPCAALRRCLALPPPPTPPYCTPFTPAHPSLLRIPHSVTVPLAAPAPR